MRLSPTVGILGPAPKGSAMAPSEASTPPSLVVWGSLRVAVAPADERHPYGYGKAEALAGIVASVAIILTPLRIADAFIHIEPFTGTVTPRTP